MWLILCHETDAAALWAYKGLGRRGLTPLELVTAENLAHGTRWRSVIGTTRRTLEVHLGDGRVIDGRRVRGTLNRLQWVPAEAVGLGTPADRAYAMQELYAFYMGWLYALPAPLINPPTPQGLSGRWRYPSEWSWLAGQAGLPVRPLHVTPANHDLVAAAFSYPPSTPTRRTLLVLDGTVVGDAPRHILDGAEELWRLAGTPLLGVDFDVSDQDAWVLSGVSVLPDLRRGGTALLDRLHAVLRAAA